MMTDKQNDNQNQRYIKEAAGKLASPDTKVVIKILSEIRAKGNAFIIPHLIELLNNHESEEVRNEVVLILSELKDPACAPIMVNCLGNNPQRKYLSNVIASCWESGLDYSAHLNTFATLFIDGDYQIALESFTVIEENIWRADKGKIENCCSFLKEKEATIKQELKPLCTELIRILQAGTTENAEDYPDIYNR